MSKVVRSVKNVTKGYSSVQVKVRNATSNDPWGPTGTEMSEIAALTYNNPTDFYEIMDMLDKRLNDKGKNWRHVLKSLKVLDYCLHEGSELVVTWARKNVYIIKTLREFQYIDEDGRDVGQNVRVAAKELTALLLDEDRLRSERSDRKLWKSRVSGPDDAMHGIAGGSDMGYRPPRRRERQQRNADEEDIEYRLAIEASKHEAEEDKKRRERNARLEEEDDELAKAIKLSKEEEELRRRELEESNAASLFDDATPAAQPQPTGYNQGYQQQGAVDWFGNPVDAQLPMTTGFLNNQYSQPTGFQSQPTGYANGFANGFQTQPNTFDQSQFPQQTGFLQPQPTIQPQPTAFNNSNPYGNDIWGQQQQPPAPPQQNDFLHPGSHNPWAQNNQPQPLDALKPAPTGSNNPFASSFTRAQAQMQLQPQKTGPPSLNTLAEQRTATQAPFNNPIINYQAPQQLNPPKPEDPQRARLNAILATGDGQDTFGNVGDLRIPAQHTTPGVFVNSAGSGLERIRAAQTGNNPFLNQNFTGAPQQVGFGQPNNNPFGARQPQQGGSLIDL
ncbi:hypothetical protein D8B26_001528 [Coccidioides posadasii str. Silveira]|uniref:ENTH domain containing protein n=2 Tax=Coccidioides posadasii TaxID=199306 RepID=C5PFW9_COCP7|nr:ENTH domain containing protein [Coccidioides posadasii C735 delta SOWgp]EER23422.1 ENTH domain containing protein [Coccidioides posadasii C735 delta SOWgp]QVM06824.1 hypothetical protein D8B26_001528 [Coccidioides posadasii str. Silveira]|eukprot:XP_003065567.1 ENTH domain containing protein [Coccidioides posadasii C735 delta SOWgp]